MAAAANDSLADEKAPDVGRYEEMEQDGGSGNAKARLSGLLWHGGSAYDAWFSCASNQVNSFSVLASVCSASCIIVLTL